MNLKLITRGIRDLIFQKKFMFQENILSNEKIRKNQHSPSKSGGISFWNQPLKLSNFHHFQKKFLLQKKILSSEKIRKNQHSPSENGGTPFWNQRLKYCCNLCEIYENSIIFDRKVV